MLKIMLNIYHYLYFCRVPRNISYRTAQLRAQFKWRTSWPVSCSCTIQPRDVPCTFTPTGVTRRRRPKPSISSYRFWSIDQRTRSDLPNLNRGKDSYKVVGMDFFLEIDRICWPSNLTFESDYRDALIWALEIYH